MKLSSKSHFRIVALVALIGSLAVQACRHTDDDEGLSNFFKTSYTGYTVQGEAQVCYPQGDEKSCPKPFTEQQAYRQACTQAGFVTYFCRCDSYLCSSVIPTLKPQLGANTGPTIGPDVSPWIGPKQPFGKDVPSKKHIFSGFDAKGLNQTCEAMPTGQMCTMEFSQGDEFASKCRSLGHKAFQCGCHSFLCSAKIDFEASR